MREHFPRSASRLFVEEDDGAIRSANLLPVRDALFVNVFDLIARQHAHAAFPDIVGDDDRDGVAANFSRDECDRRIFLTIVIGERLARHTDVDRAVADSGDAARRSALSINSDVEILLRAEHLRGFCSDRVHGRRTVHAQPRGGERGCRSSDEEHTDYDSFFHSGILQEIMKEVYVAGRLRWLLDLRRAALLTAVFAITFAPLLLSRLRGKKVVPATIGARVRKAFERLGVTYVKLGQFLAMRFDILPEEVCRELAQLFDKVPPMPHAAVMKTVESELGAPPEEIFAQFDAEPLAAASIAQVHRASLPDGTRVAVKIQRPRIQQIFAADIRNLKRLARVGDALRVLGPQSTRDAVEEFERFTSREMNFLTEARTAERLRANAGAFEEVPRVHFAFTTERVLTLDFVDAPSLAQIVHGLEDGDEEKMSRLRVDAQHVI